MKKCAGIVVAAMMIAGLVVGCGGKDEKTKGTGVGVVDFPTLFQKLGYAQKVEDKLRAADQQLAMMRTEALKPEQATATKLQSALTEAYRAVVTSRPAAANDQEILMRDPALAAAGKAKSEFESRVKKYADQYPAQLESYKRTLQDNLSTAILPALGKVGPTKGVEIIVGRQQVSWNAAEVDLTAAMEEHLRRENPDFKFAEPPDWTKSITPLDKVVLP